MPNELVPQTESGSLEKFNEACSDDDYLPRFQLFGSKSDAVAEGKIPAAHWGLNKDDLITDLGAEIDAVIVTWRSTAIQTKPDFIINHDVESEIYQQIKALSAVQDSGAMYGKEFLIWIPDANTYATLHMNSKTARREAKRMGPLLGKAATFKSKLIDNGRYQWHGPVVLPCSVSLSVPPTDNLLKMRDTFEHPVVPELETAPDDTRDR